MKIFLVREQVDRLFKRIARGEVRSSVITAKLSPGNSTVIVDGIHYKYAVQEDELSDRFSIEATYDKKLGTLTF